MLNIIRNIIKYNKEAISLMLFLPTIFIIINSSLLLPIIISIILSYFLYNIKKLLNLLGCPLGVSFVITYILFLTLFLLILFILLPLVFKQMLGLFNDLPFMIQKIKFITYRFIEKYPFIFPAEQTNIFFSNIIAYVQSIGKTIISASLLSLAIIIKWILYIFLIPILVFFFLKDHSDIILWFKKIMPEKAKFWGKIWHVTNKQIANYIRGKFIEMLIITIISYILFKSYKLVYADLLAFGVGISVIIPYIGTIIISVPVLFISAVQLGLTHDFLYFNIIYILIHFLDGNLLVPILFSETVDLHPISIIMAIIIFGSTLNVYGVFFAIPFAIVIKAIINLYLTPITLK